LTTQSTQIQKLTPKTIKMSAKGDFGQKLKELRSSGATPAAVGVHRSANQAQVTMLPKSMLDEARKGGSAQRKIEFDPKYDYYGQVAKQTEIGIAALSAEDKVEQSPAFDEVSREIATSFNDGERLARREGASQLYGTELDNGSTRHIRQLGRGGKTQLAAQFVDGQLVATTGQSKMVYRSATGIRQMLQENKQPASPWNEIPTPEFARKDATLGRVSRRRNVIGLKDGRVSAVELTTKDGNIEASYQDAIPGGSQIIGTTIGLLPGHRDLAVSVTTNGKKSATITLTRVDQLSKDVQQMIQG